MRKCWAKSLGDCSGPISGEHVVSAGLFQSAVVSVEGFSWCKGEAKNVGLKTLTRKILCMTHNSRLSPVDDAAIAAFRVFREYIELTNVRETMEERYWTVVHREIDGSKLERWFLKTLINVTFDGQDRIGGQSLMPGLPSTELVEMAFGLRRIPPKAGLYFFAEAGDTISQEDRISISPFFHGDNEYVMGGIFSFYGFQFVLHLGQAGFSSRVEFVDKRGGVSRSNRPTRHLRKLRYTVGSSRKRVSHVIDFKWLPE